MAKSKRSKPASKEDPASTEERIKEAARIVFTRKGYSATRTRDIAEEAGINLALLNYYFRSKEKLFQIIMMEKVQKLLGVMAPLVNDPDITLELKVKAIVENYFTLLKDNPDLPLFVLSEIRNDAHGFEKQVRIGQLLRESHMLRQIQERRPDVDPLQMAASLLSMIVFPFVARPLLFGTDKKGTEIFQEFIRERTELIPKWFKSILKTT